jgi:hypothetical protein
MTDQTNLMPEKSGEKEEHHPRVGTLIVVGLFLIVLVVMKI